jgi:hypothetical protein
MKYYIVILYAPDTVSEDHERIDARFVPAWTKKGNMLTVADAIEKAQDTAYNDAKEAYPNARAEFICDDWIATHVFHETQLVWQAP